MNLFIYEKIVKISFIASINVVNKWCMAIGESDKDK